MLVAGVTEAFSLHAFLLSKKLGTSVHMPGEVHDAWILPVANLPEAWASLTKQKKNSFILTFRLLCLFP